MEILKLITEKYLLWAIVLVLLVNLYQKKGGEFCKHKRYATLSVAFLVLLFNILSVFIIQFNLPLWTLATIILIIIVVGYYLRKYIMVFKLKCPICKSKLNMTDYLTQDDNICSKCKTTKVEDINWEEWEPTEVCTLSYIINNNDVLLIEKKTGLGKGLVNGPGGHVEDGETVEAATIRECKEETGLEIKNIEYKGVLDFHFLDGLKMRGYIYIAKNFSGDLMETEEAKPFWCSLNQLPLDKMWEDDKLWLEEVLQGKTVNGKFIFNKESMLSHKVELC